MVARLVDAEPFGNFRARGVADDATRDDDQYFYPEKSYVKSDQAGLKEMDWPAGVRRFSYRKKLSRERTRRGYLK